MSNNQNDLMSTMPGYSQTSECCNPRLHEITKRIWPIVGHMLNIAVFEDDEDDKVKIFVGTKSAKMDVEMLLPDDVKDDVSVEIASNPNK